MKRVLLLLSDDSQTLGAADLTTVLGFGGAFGDAEIEVITIGVHPQLRGTSGLTTTSRFRFDGLDSDDDLEAVAMPAQSGGVDYAGDASSDQFLDVFLQFAARGKPVAAVCTGSMPVARSGVLKGPRGATIAAS